MVYIRKIHLVNSIFRIIMHKTILLLANFFHCFCTYDLFFGHTMSLYLFSLTFLLSRRLMESKLAHKFRPPTQIYQLVIRDRRVAVVVKDHREEKKRVAFTRCVILFLICLFVFAYLSILYLRMFIFYRLSSRIHGNNEREFLNDDYETLALTNCYPSPCH